MLDISPVFVLYVYFVYLLEMDIGSHPKYEHIGSFKSWTVLMGLHQALQILGVCNAGAAYRFRKCIVLLKELQCHR